MNNGKSNVAKKTSPATDESRLVGWLVSYGLDENGVAYEIRAGRSFISSKNLPDQRIITLADEEVSSPHMALNASPRHRVMVQDIFSEHGSYLTKGANAKEIPVSGPMEIQHGDWLRVGNNARFQVCLIDGPAK